MDTAIPAVKNKGFMPTTVRAAFRELLGRIELNPSRVAIASQRYNSVKKTIENILPGVHVLQVGSFQRKTKIRPVDLGDGLDIDVLVALTAVHAFAQPGEDGISTDQALNVLRSALTSNRTYKVMKPRFDAPVIVLEYADKDKFKIELIPALVDRTGLKGLFRSVTNTRPDSYQVPGSDGDWHRADYLYDANYITSLNTDPLFNGTVVPFIKIAKACLRGWEVPMKSFHVEIIAALTASEIVRDWYFKGLAWGYHHLLAAFLEASPRYMFGPIALPGSESEPLNSDLSMKDLWDVSTWMNEQSKVAWRICELQDGPLPIKAWRSFIGSPFPSS